MNVSRLGSRPPPTWCRARAAEVRGSNPLHHSVPANRPGFPGDKNPGNSGKLAIFQRSDQHCATIDHDHLTGAVAFPHQIDVSASEILRLADTTDRKPLSKISVHGFRAGSGAELPISNLSDNPLVPLQETAKRMKELGLSAAELRAIGRENAIALLPNLPRT
jgi:hypothetical protein